MASEARLGKREYIVTGTALVRFKIRTRDDSPTDARDTVGCMDMDWLEGAEEACIEDVNIDTVSRARSARAASGEKEGLTSRDLHEWQIEMDRARKRAADAEASLEAAKKRASEAEETICTQVARANNIEAQREAEHRRVQELENALGEACDLVEAWNRSANSMEKPPASTRAKLARLRSLLRGDKLACGTCGGKRTVERREGECAWFVPCPACSASPGAGKKKG